jgi:hypothetical protein
MMNLITHKRAYSIYPRATFIEQRSLANAYRDGSHCDENMLRKYTERGWKQLRHLDVKEYTNPTSSFKKGIRALGDRHCWTIDLKPTIDAEEDYMESNTWNLEYLPPRSRQRSYNIVYWKHDWKVLREHELYDHAYLSDIERMFFTREMIKLHKASEFYGQG